MNKLLVKMTNDWDRRASLLFSELWCARINLVLASHLLPKFQLINAYVDEDITFRLAEGAVFRGNDNSSRS